MYMLCWAKPLPKGTGIPEIDIMELTNSGLYDPLRFENISQVIGSLKQKA